MKRTPYNFLAIATGAAGMALFSVNTAFASIEQTSEYSILGSSLVQSFQNDSTKLLIKQGQHRFVGEDSNGEVTTNIQFSQNFAGNGLHLNFSHGQSEQHLVLGYSLGRFTFSAMRGEAQSFVRDAGSFQGVDRFSFHGGIDAAFDFYGAGLDAKLAKTVHAQIGFAQLESRLAGLETRGAQYFELSSSANYGGLSDLYGRISFFDRGGENIGQGFETGFAYNDAAFTMQAMAVDGNKRLLRFRSQYALSHATSLFFDISQAKDPSHFDPTRYTSMLSIQHFIGKKPNVYFSLKEDNPNAGKKKKTRYNRPLLIGAGVVAGAALASSGSDSSDSSVRSQAETDAAFIVLSRVNPESVRQNREFGGWVYRNQDNTFGTSTPVGGGVASVVLPDPRISTPPGSRITASYHTHGGPDPRFDNENFSPQDIRSDNSLGIGGYLGTPGGTFQYHFGGNIQLLGRLPIQ